MADTPDTVEARNKETIERLTRTFNDLDREAFDACYAEEIHVHSISGTRTMDHDEHWEEVLGIFESFPDLEATMESLVAEGDRVFGRWVYAGTFDGFPKEEPDPEAVEDPGDETEKTDAETSDPVADAVGTHVEWRHWSEYRLEDGRVVEAWQLSDGLHLNTELGFVEEV